MVSFLVAVILVLFGIVAMLIQDSLWVGLVIFLAGLFIGGAGRALAIKVTKL